MSKNQKPDLGAPDLGVSIRRPASGPGSRWGALDELAGAPVPDAALDRVAADARLPSLQPAPAVGAGLPDIQRPLKADIPEYVHKQLEIRMAETGTSKRYLVLMALKQAGYRVEDADLYSDGRRLRGRRALTGV